MSWQFEVGVDFWTTGGAGRTSRVMVSPETEKLFVNFLESTDIQHTLTVTDVESTMKVDKMARTMSRLKRAEL